MYYLCIRLQINISVLFWSVKPEGGGRGQPYAGHLTSISFPTLGKPGWRRLLFCAEEWDKVTSSHVFVFALAILELK